MFLDALNEAFEGLIIDIESIKKRVSTIEHTFKMLIELDARINTLEFNSDKPTHPGISEQLIELRNKIDSISELLPQFKNTITPI